MKQEVTLGEASLASVMNARTADGEKFESILPILNSSSGLSSNSNLNSSSVSIQSASSNGKPNANFNLLHQQALAAAQDFKASERKLQEVLRKIGEEKAYYHLGYRSLYEYATQALGLTPDVAYNHCAVAKKTEALPEVRKAIDEGVLTVSKVRHMAPVLNSGNQKEMIRLGSELSQPELRKEIARLNPELEEKPEKARYVREGRVALELRVSESLMIKLRRAQDLVSQSERKLVSLEETLEAVMEVYLQKTDPLEKAKRAAERGKDRESTLPPGKSLEDGKGKVKTGSGKDSRFREDSGSRKESGRVTEPGAKGDLGGVIENTDALMGNESLSFNQDTQSDTPKKFRIIRKKEPGIQWRNGSGVQSFKRTAIPAAERHRVLLREKGRCSHRDTKGKQCAQTRFLHFHHLHPVSLGGSNRAENLALLCSGHHRMLHVRGESAKPE